MLNKMSTSIVVLSAVFIQDSWLSFFIIKFNTRNYHHVDVIRVQAISGMTPKTIHLSLQLK